jgi:hypothetical protein
MVTITAEAFVLHAASTDRHCPNILCIGRNMSWRLYPTNFSSGRQVITLETFVTAASFDGRSYSRNLSNLLFHFRLSAYRRFFAEWVILDVSKDLTLENEGSIFRRNVRNFENRPAT